MVEIIARLATDSALHVLVRAGGEHRIHTTIKDPLVVSDPLAPEEVEAWLQTMRECGGEVLARGAVRT